MTSLDDLDLMDATTPATLSQPKKCRRHDWFQHPYPTPCYGVDGEIYLEPGVVHCKRCFKVRDETVRRRNRSNAKRGKAIQRQRIVALGGQNLPGNKQNHDGIGTAFSYESKSGPSNFSERYWRWLKAIPVTADQTQVLIVTSADGRGRKARSYVVLDFDDWRAWHGEDGQG